MLNSAISFSWPALGRWACLSALVLGGSFAQAAEKQTPVDVELFAAVEAGQVGVTLIPSDETRMNLQIENLTDKPLAIRMPGAFVGAPVLAQFQPGNPFFAGPQQNAPRNQQPQVLGGGIPNGGNRNNNNNLLNNNPFFGNAIFNVPAEKVIKVKVPSVCLEYGKPTPGPRIAYEIRPLESFSSDSTLRELLERFAQGEHSQRVAQLAAWHLSNDMSWEDLSALSIKHIIGRSTPRFSRDEIRQARELVESLPSHKGRKSPATESLGQR